MMHTYVVGRMQNPAFYKQPKAISKEPTKTTITDELHSKPRNIIKRRNTSRQCVIGVPKVDCGPLDNQNLILETRNDVYRVGTKCGLIKTWYARNTLQISIV